MRKILMGMSVLLAAGFMGLSAQAAGHGGGWVLDGDASTVVFGSVKKDTVGETHHFSGLAGTVSADGEVSVEIDLGSVETWIEKRNVRMIEHVFMDAPTATLSTTIDMSKLADLAVGGIQEVDIAGTLSLGAVSTHIEATMIAVRLSETRVMILTAEMIWVSTADAGIDAGIDIMKELAGLSGITRSFPVTLRLVFDLKM